jgi:hypothetical protein
MREVMTEDKVHRSTVPSSGPAVNPGPGHAACRWCGAPVPDWPGKAYCTACNHRSEVPPAQCDCMFCTGRLGRRFDPEEDIDLSA